MVRALGSVAVEGVDALHPAALVVDGEAGRRPGTSRAPRATTVRCSRSVALPPMKMPPTWVARTVPRGAAGVRAVDPDHEPLRQPGPRGHGRDESSSTPATAVPATPRPVSGAGSGVGDAGTAAAGLGDSSNTPSSASAATDRAPRGRPIRCGFGPIRDGGQRSAGHRGHHAGPGSGTGRRPRDPRRVGPPPRRAAAGYAGDRPGRGWRRRRRVTRIGATASRLAARSARITA